MSYSVFCSRILFRCKALRTQAIIYSDGEQLKVCYSRSNKYKRYCQIDGSTRVIGHYDSGADVDAMAEDIRDFFLRRDETKEYWKAGIDQSLNPVVDKLLGKLHKVSGARLAALKVALRDFNIQKQRWYERGSR